MGNRANYLRPILTGFLFFTSAIVELYIVPGVGGKLGVLFLCILGAAIWLVRRFGAGPVRRAFGAITLGATIGIISSHTLALMISMGLHLPPSECFSAILLPIPFCIWLAFLCTRVRFIRFSFTSGLVVGWLLLSILHYYF